MPGTRETAANLTRIANEASTVAVEWHAVIALVGGLRLGAAIDWSLLAGALGLFVQHVLAPSRRAQLRCPWSTASVPGSADAATLGARFDTG